ncbi:hypothetical protein ACX0G9_02165 [Flavitalea flava]
MENKKNPRRYFIRNMGLGAAATLASPLLNAKNDKQVPLPENSKTAQPEEQDRTPNKEKTWVKLDNGIQLELLTTQNDFHGIGQVMSGDILLRDGTHPLFCHIRSPESINITRYSILEKIISPQRIFIKMDVERHTTGLMEFMLHTVRNRENLYDWVDAPEKDSLTTIVLEILPVTRHMGGQSWEGFSYQYTFQSGSFAIYKILDRGTWEIGGQASGNECWMRIGHIPSIVRMDKQEDRYSTENYYKGIANPNVFQFLPLQTELQGFTFTAHDEGVLITYPARVAHVRTLLEKPQGKDHIFHYHQHCNDLSDTFQTSPVEVLWIPEKKTDRIARYNIYESVRASVHKSLHIQAGIKEETISTYGQIEEWTEPDFDRYTDHILPRLVEKGVKRVFIPNQFQNAMNTWGLSNMCCNIDYKFSETAGVDKIKRFCAAAKAAGVTVEMWGNTAISTLAEMFRSREGRKKGIDFLPEKNSIAEVLEKAKEPFVRNPANAIEADHYTPRFAMLNLRDPDIFAYWMKSWRTAYDVGIGSIFLDSSFNMTSDKFHFIQNAEKDRPVITDDKEGQQYYRPGLQPPAAIMTQYPAHLRLVREMQEAGYSYCGEDLGVFGIHRHGPDMHRISTCMPLWRDCVINFDAGRVGQGNDPLAVFFKGLAYRIGWALRWDFSKDRLEPGIEDPRAFQYIKAFNAVNELMKLRHILPDEKGVQYIAGDGHTICLWTMVPHTLTFEGNRKIWDVMTDKRINTDKLEARAMGIYTIGS